jgi:hypothetical protein
MNEALASEQQGFGLQLDPGKSEPSPEAHPQNSIWDPSLGEQHRWRRFA